MIIINILDRYVSVSLPLVPEKCKLLQSAVPIYLYFQDLLSPQHCRRNLCSMYIKGKTTQTICHAKVGYTCIYKCKCYFVVRPPLISNTGQNILLFFIDIAALICSFPHKTSERLRNSYRWHFYTEYSELSFNKL